MAKILVKDSVEASIGLSKSDLSQGKPVTTFPSVASEASNQVPSYLGRVATTDSSEGNVICPLCGSLVTQLTIEKWNMSVDELRHVEELLEHGTFLEMLKFGELASRHLNPDLLSTDLQVQQSLSALSQKAQKLLTEQQSHLKAVTEGQQALLKSVTDSERADKLDVRKEALQEQTRIVEDYQKKILDLSKQMKDTADQRLAETKAFTDAIGDIREKLVGVGVGRIEEASLTKELKSASPRDYFVTRQSTKGRADIVAEVMVDGKVAGKVVISSKADNNWSEEFREQLKKNLEQERTRWGILVTKSFPSDALNDKAYLDDEQLLLVKFEYAAVAYLGMRESIIRWHEAEARFTEVEKRIQREKSVLQALRGWVSGDKFAEMASRIDAARRLSKETEDLLEDWESYNKTKATKIHQAQQKLRVALGDCDGLLADLRTRLD